MDRILVLGDMGLFWRKDQKDADYKIELYEKECNGVHLYWIDGNHENFDIINSWNYNKNYVYDNSDHIHYCPRGYKAEIYINGEIKKCLFIGGADSVDKIFRTKHLSWWSDEQITEKNIEGIENEYDYVFSHCCPYSVFNYHRYDLCTIGGLNQNKVDHTSEAMLDKVYDKISFKHWWFGHYHIDKTLLDDKFTCVFNDFIELE